MPTVYILQDGDNRIYIGSTTDLERRQREHRRGHTSTTRKLRDFTVVWKKDTVELAEARKIERKIKNWKSRRMVDLLIRGVIDV